MTTDLVALVSPYKSRGALRLASKNDSALNYYAEELAHALAEERRVCVITARTSDESPWSDGPVDVRESYQRGKIQAVFQMVVAAKRSGARIIHVQHELFAFGGMLSALILPFGLAILRLLRRRVVTTIHGIVPLESIDRDFVAKNGAWMPPAMARFGWRGLLKAICAASNGVIVHEPLHRERLLGEYGVRSNVDVLPIGVAQVPDIGTDQKAEARRALLIPPNAEVLTFFGYFAGYKGLERLLDAVPELLESRQQLHIIIAGDVSDRLEEASTVRSRLIIMSRQFERLHALGFVLEPQVARLFAATDTLILPYTSALAASGPLTISAAYKVPALLSNALATMMPQAPIAFEPDVPGICAAVATFFDDANARKRAHDFVDNLAKERAWSQIAKELVRVYERVE